MKKHLLSLLLLLAIFQLSAQELERQVVSSFGTIMTSSDLSMVTTLGELAVETFDTPDLVLAQGFNQGSVTIVSTFDFNNDISFEVFPNPAAAIVYITSNSTEDLTLEIVDLMGRTISVQDLTFPVKKEAVIVDHLADAPYFLYVSNTSGKLFHTFTIQKK